jgi:hypothetical protein
VNKEQLQRQLFRLTRHSNIPTSDGNTAVTFCTYKLSLPTVVIYLLLTGKSLPVTGTSSSVIGISPQDPGTSLSVNTVKIYIRKTAVILYYTLPPHLQYFSPELYYNSALFGEQYIFQPVARGMRSWGRQRQIQYTIYKYKFSRRFIHLENNNKHYPGRQVFLFQKRMGAGQSFAMDWTEE